MLLIIFKGNTRQRCGGRGSWQEQHQCGEDNSSIIHHSVQTGLYTLPCQGLQWETCTPQSCALCSRCTDVFAVLLTKCLTIDSHFFSKCSQNSSYFCLHLYCWVLSRLLSLSFLWKSCVRLKPEIRLNFRILLKKAIFCTWWLNSITSIPPNAHWASIKCLGAFRRTTISRTADALENRHFLFSYDHPSNPFLGDLVYPTSNL